MMQLQAKNKTPFVISVGGFDPSGGAGILADVKTFSSLGIWSASAITCLTVQDNKNFYATKNCDADNFKTILENFGNKYYISGLKIGLITDYAHVDILIDFIKKYRPKFVILDPVIKSSSGYVFWDENFQKYVLNKLMPLCDVITPNYKEAMSLISSSGITNPDFMNEEDLIRTLQKFLRNKIVITGGDSKYISVVKDYIFDGLNLEIRESEFFDIPNCIKHGTGCTFSSALCAYILQGYDFMEAVKKAAVYVENSIKSFLQFSKDDGGLNHCWAISNQLNNKIIKEQNSV